jgi:hypothetical protein
MLNDLRFIVNWIVEVRSITYVSSLMGAVCPFLAIKRWIIHKFSLPIL